MSNKTVLTIIGIALMVWAVNGLKHSSFLNPRAATQLQAVDWRNADYRPYQRSGLENDPEEAAFAAKQKGFKLAKAGTFANAEVGVAKNANPVVAKAETKDKKKKKKKKKDARKIPPADRPTSTAQTTKSNKHSATIENTPEFVSGPAIPQPQTDETKSFQEWANLLLNAPNKVLVDRFIREYQSNLVSANVFYSIIDLMFEKDDSRFRELAVRAAGSVYTVTSYEFLLTVLSKESNGSVAANSAQAELYQYETPMGLGVVLQILTGRSQDAVAIGYAVQTLENSTKKFLVTPPPADPATPAAPARPNHYAKLYASFISPLQQIIATYSGDASIAESARRALQNIQSSRQEVVADN